MLKISDLLETEQHDTSDIPSVSLQHELTALAAYYKLLAITSGTSVLLDEYAGEIIEQEQMHLDEVNMVLRRAGNTALFIE